MTVLGSVSFGVISRLVIALVVRFCVLMGQRARVILSVYRQSDNIIIDIKEGTNAAGGWLRVSVLLLSVPSDGMDVRSLG